MISESIDKCITNVYNRIYGALSPSKLTLRYNQSKWHAFTGQQQTEER